MFIAGIAILYAWIAGVIAAVFAFFKWVFRLSGKRAGTRQRHNEPTA
ncbi:MAG TPA: hypothetical protein VKU87_12545 [Thermomicrobiaceae bacterium]|nr:hypothetical protein [Thermomicrobiaceae bacterium]